MSINVYVVLFSRKANYISKNRNLGLLHIFQLVQLRKMMVCLSGLSLVFKYIFIFNLVITWKIAYTQKYITQEKYLSIFANIIFNQILIFKIGVEGREVMDMMKNKTIFTKRYKNLDIFKTIFSHISPSFYQCEHTVLSRITGHYAHSIALCCVYCRSA